MSSADRPILSLPLERRRANLARQAMVWVLLLLGLLLSLYVARYFGGAGLGLPSDADPVLRDKILAVRYDRILGACIVGVALAVSGVALQSLLRNPLAEPFILGLSTGAGVGVMVQMLLATRYVAFAGRTQWGALLGAAVSLAIVYFAGRRNRVVDPLGMLLIGVVLSTINGAIIMFLNYVPGSVGIRANIAQWMMGYLDEDVLGDHFALWSGVTMPVTWGLAAIVAAGAAAVWVNGRAMDVASLSDAEAESLGVNVARLRTMLFLTASVLAAVAVMVAGPIAFVGLICPHLARLMLGPGHRPLLLASAVLGAILMLLADMTSNGLHIAFRWGIMPLGIFTAALGGLFFLWMLRGQIGRQG